MEPIYFLILTPIVVLMCLFAMWSYCEFGLMIWEDTKGHHRNITRTLLFLLSPFLIIACVVFGFYQWLFNKE